MKTRSILPAVAALIAIASGCNKTEGKKEEPKIPIRISTSVTKVSDNDFESGDAIGLYVVNAVASGENSWSSGNLQAGGNHLDNARFSYDGSNWKSDQEHYWKDSVTPADFYCYYPYSATVSSLDALEFTIPTDQTALADFKKGEILWGCASNQKPSNNKVSISTTHRMSQIAIEILPGKGFTEESLKESVSKVRVNNIACTASLNIKDGTLSAKGAATDITPYNDNGIYRAFIVPQKVDNKVLVTLTVDGQERTLLQTIEFTSGSRKKCTLTVNKLNEGVNVSIGGWDDDNKDYGGTLN